MSAQRHIIKRQVLEVTVSRSIDPQWLQTELSRIYRQRLAPLIDQYCTELSAPDRLHRIARLEIDLGRVDLQRLEDALAAAISVQFKTLLSEQISVQEHPTASPDTPPKTASQLELFSLFAQAGGLPWWADAGQPDLLEHCLHHLLQYAPAALRRVMHDLAQEERPLQRLVAHYDEALLADLAGLLAPVLKASLPHLPQELVAGVQRTAALLGRTPAQLRQRVWHSLLAVASLQGQRSTAAVALYRDTLMRVAAALGVTYAALVANLYQVMQQGGGSWRSQLREMCETLFRELPGTARPHDALDTAPDLEPASPDMLVPRLAQSPATGDPRARRWTVLRDRLTAQDDLAPTDLSPPLLEALTSRLEAAVHDVGTPSIRPAAPPVDLRFSDADELYIDNAGLVILWPFLGHFFARLSLVEDTRFTDSAARHRAVALLQYLATADPFPPAYLLPLNKVLCGMAPDEVCRLDTPLTEAEAEECTMLLTAVIAHAPILHNMSVPGFRGTFLLRRGQLSARDGAWLLRVERTTYDVVLDRFPWSIAWVKLPWMDTLLRVEW